MDYRYCIYRLPTSVLRRLQPTLCKRAQISGPIVCGLNRFKPIALSRHAMVASKRPSLFRGQYARDQAYYFGKLRISTFNIVSLPPCCQPLIPKFILFIAFRSHSRHHGRRDQDYSACSRPEGIQPSNKTAHFTDSVRPSIFLCPYSNCSSELSFVTYSHSIESCYAEVSSSFNSPSRLSPQIASNHLNIILSYSPSTIPCYHGHSRTLPVALSLARHEPNTTVLLEENLL